MRKKRRTFREWRIVADAAKDWDIDIMKSPRPLAVGDHETPENLDTMTMGQMLTLQSCGDGWDLFYVICRELLGMSDEETDKADAAQVVMFVGWAVKQMSDINKMFAGIKASKTSEEVRAGIEKLDFGAFGLIDWYARRMGITDHDEVMDVPYLRVYQCLKMDNDRGEYEKRLAKIYRESK